MFKKEKREMSDDVIWHVLVLANALMPRRIWLGRYTCCSATHQPPPGACVRDARRCEL